MSNPRQGVLIYDEESGRFDIRFSLEEYYGGLHYNRWYLVGIKTEHLTGLRVRI